MRVTLAERLKKLGYDELPQEKLNRSHIRMFVNSVNNRSVLLYRYCSCLECRIYDKDRETLQYCSTLTSAVEWLEKESVKSGQ